MKKKNSYPFYIAFLILASFHFISCSQEKLDTKPKECGALFPPLDTIIGSHTDFTKSHYPKRIEVFMTDTVNESDIVMLGNSLTEKGGNWAARLGIDQVKNRGIAGDNAYGVLARLNELVCNEPQMVFLMIGTNDIWLVDSPQTIASNIQTIATKLGQLPKTTVYVQTIMPMGFGHPMTQKIAQVNELLMEIDSEDFILMDTYTEMIDGRGALPDAFTTDGVHLTELAYQKWADFIKTYLHD